MDDMKKNIRIIMLAVVIFGSGFDLFGVELQHLWNFNEDFSDSIGGVTAQKCGSEDYKYVSIYGKKLYLGGFKCTNNTGYVSLG